MNHIIYSIIRYNQQEIHCPFCINDNAGFIQCSIFRLLLIDYNNIKWIECKIDDQYYILGMDINFRNTLENILLNRRNVEFIINPLPYTHITDNYISNYCKLQYEQYIYQITNPINPINPINIYPNNDSPISMIRNAINEHNSQIYQYYLEMQNNLQRIYQYTNLLYYPNNANNLIENNQISENILPSPSQHLSDNIENENNNIPIIDLTFIIRRNSNNHNQPENDQEGEEDEDLEINGENNRENNEDDEENDDREDGEEDVIFPLNNFQHNIFDLLLNTLQPIYHQEDVRMVMDEDVYDELPKMTYKDWKEQNDTPEYQPTECTICLEKYTDESTDQIVKMPQCIHIFHNECIKPWLLENSYKCPVCRKEQGRGTPI